MTRTCDLQVRNPTSLRHLRSLDMRPRPPSAPRSEVRGLESSGCLPRPPLGSDLARDGRSGYPHCAADPAHRVSELIQASEALRLVPIHALGRPIASLLTFEQPIFHRGYENGTAGFPIPPRLIGNTATTCATGFVRSRGDTPPRGAAESGRCQGVPWSSLDLRWGSGRSSTEYAATGMG